jgi:predicted kinase
MSRRKSLEMETNADPSETEWAQISVKLSKRQPKRTPGPHRLSWIDELPVIPPSSTFSLAVILLVGLPGSGKSTFANALCRSLPWKYVRINQDELKSRGACLEAMRTTLVVDHKCPIVDRCNMSRAQRATFSTNDVPTDCIALDIPVETCIYRCQQRRNHPTVQPSEAQQIIGWQQNEYEAPHQASEGFRSVRVVSCDETFRRVVVDMLMRND